MNPVKQLWEAWKGFSHYVAEFQSRFILAVFFYMILLPVGLLFWMRRIAGKLNSLPPSSSNWIVRQDREVSLDSAKQQF